MTTYTEIVGFDLGHAETAITQTQKDATTQPKVLKVNGESPVITAVAVGRDGQVEIGENAVVGENQESVRVMFKSPRLENPDTRRPTKLFVQRILDTLSEQKQIQGGDGSLFVVGCPSGWSPKTRAVYEALLREAGMRNVMVTPESRGAFLSARESRDIPEKDLTGSVLIIDIGSSTTDFTAVSNLEEEPIDFGENKLGAGIIDQIIFKRSLNTQEDSAELKGLLDSYPPTKAKCLLLCRRVKEKYFNRRTSATSVELITDGTTEVIYKVKISSDSEMDEVLSIPIGEFLEQSNPELSQLDWKAAFRTMLEKAKKKTMADPPQSILLTGGASRMQFVENLCREVFPEAREVKRGAEPEYAIAQGLALAGRMSEKTQIFRKEIGELFQSGKLRNALQASPDDDTPSAVDQLIFGITFFITSNLIDNIIFPAFVEWREGQISTLNDMESAIKERTEQFFKNLNDEGAQELEETILVDWIDKFVRPSVEKLVEPICERADIPSSELGLSQDFYMNLPHVGYISSSNVSDVALGDIEAMGTMTAVIGSIIIATLLGGGGTALLFSGPVGWMIGLVIGVVATFLGKKVAMDVVRDADLWVWTRELLTNEDDVQEHLSKMIPNGGEDDEEEYDEDEENPEQAFWQICEALQEKADAFDELLTGIEAKVKEEMDRKAERAALLIK